MDFSFHPRRSPGSPSRISPRGFSWSCDGPLEASLTVHSVRWFINQCFHQMMSHRTVPGRTRRGGGPSESYQQKAQLDFIRRLFDPVQPVSQLRAQSAQQVRQVGTSPSRDVANPVTFSDALRSRLELLGVPIWRCVGRPDVSGLAVSTCCRADPKPESIRPALGAVKDLPGEPVPQSPSPITCSSSVFTWPDGF